jgi:hypothetical protein
MNHLSVQTELDFLQTCIIKFKIRKKKKAKVTNPGSQRGYVTSRFIHFSLEVQMSALCTSHPSHPQGGS